jgi:DNA (cytosine-5)-methyltransferase 1
MSKKYTVADFFCGCGGFSEGFYQAGFDVVLSLDSWKLAKETHDINHPNCKCIHMDILKLKTEDFDKLIPDTDVIIGSPPCVSFSNSNNSGNANKDLGVSLIKQFLKIILYKKTKPNSKLKYWIMENVPNSIKFLKEKYTAKELGLDSNLPDLLIPIKEILTASDYGSPQGRKRAIVGDFVIPKATHLNNPVLIENIFKMLGPPINNKHEKIKDILFDFEINKSDLTDHFYDSTIPKCICDKARQLKEDHGFMGKMEFPDSINRISRTIMATEAYASRESMIFKAEHNDGYRAPTIREISSLMGFPINYQFKGSHNNKHKQIGNAVCVQLSKALGVAILEKDNIKINHIIQRDNIRLDCEQINPLFGSDFKESPKRINSKYSRHIPYLKINQFRVELDNTKSKLKDTENNKNIDTLNMNWSSSIHKGSGKKALKDTISNNELKEILDKKKLFCLEVILKKKFQNKIYNSKLFQLKNCRLDEETDHYSPDEALGLLKTILDKQFNNDVIKTKLLFNKDYEYNQKIIYGLYAMNYIVELLDK